MDFSLIGSKRLSKNTTLDISEFAPQGANFFYLDVIESFKQEFEKAAGQYRE